MKNLIDMYLHCGDCIDDKPEDVSPADYQKIQVGLINDGHAIQVWCVNHNKHMAIFELLVPYANATCHDCDCG